VSPEDAALVADALRFALERHAGKEKKGGGAPYASHLLRVAALVMEHGGDAWQIAAAFLHDVIEDCDVSDAELESRFGSDIARMVRALSDLLPGDTSEKKSPWLDRKRTYLAHLPREGARTRLVSACDKLDNLRATVADLEAEGVSGLSKFNAKPHQLRWYYVEVLRAAGDVLPLRSRREVEELLACFARHVPRLGPEP
jgi:(p)ppGpp synthase/HD superfamily hydrolase